MPRLPARPFLRLGSQSAVAAGCLALVVASTARAGTTSFQPAAPQPMVPASGARTTSPVVESLIDNRPMRDGREAAGHRHREARAHRRHPPHDVTPTLERPALAGVALLRPLPRRGEPPHLVVPLPAYGLDSIVTAATMPPPPLVCHPVRRDPTLPDPRLYREQTVVCEADNP